MNPHENIFPLYNLADQKYRKIEIITDKNERISGQFVYFNVLENNSKTSYYPKNSYCFLPVIKSKDYWSKHNSNNGVFTEFPKEITLYEKYEIVQIIITPEII